MNVKNILLKLGGSVIKNVIPGAGIFVDAVNAFLPADKKINENSTGTQAMGAVNSLPATEQAAVLNKQLDVAIAEITSFTQIQEAHAIADGPGSSTRPKIAMRASNVISFTVILFMSMWAIAVFNKDHATLKILNDSYLMVLAMIGTPVAVVLQYFGKRTKEKTDRYHLAQGQTPPISGLASIIGSVLGR